MKQATCKEGAPGRRMKQKERGAGFSLPLHPPRNLMRLNEAICVKETSAHPDVGFTPG